MPITFVGKKFVCSFELYVHSCAKHKEKVTNIYKIFISILSAEAKSLRIKEEKNAQHICNVFSALARAFVCRNFFNLF